MRTRVEGGLELPGGAWFCRWVQGWRTALEDLMLDCGSGWLRGMGTDEDGLFQTSGAVYADGSVSLTKVYLAPVITVPASLSYIGRWDGHCIRGQWIDDSCPGNNGPFTMWPGTGVWPALEADLARSPEVLLEEERVPVAPRLPLDSRRDHGR